MRRTQTARASRRIFFALFLLIGIGPQVPVFGVPSQSASFLPSSRYGASAFLEIGGDSLNQGFYQSKLSFHYPTGRFAFFMDMRNLQRINSRFRGEDDFWLMVGFDLKLSSHLTYEGKINHMCRHGTSYGEEQGILDLNEMIGEVKLETGAFRFGMGWGIYVGHTWYGQWLFVLNASLEDLWDSGLSLFTQIKYIKFEEILHDFEVSFQLSPSIDLFIRNSKDYEYRNVTYMGTRFKTGTANGKIFDFIRLDLSAYPDNKRYKMSFNNFFRLALFKNSYNRILFDVNLLIPVKASSPFLEVFDPEKIDIPTSLIYERKFSDDFFLFGYFAAILSMPFDVPKKYEAHTGLGFGFKNLSHFKDLSRRLRYEVQAGYNFSHVFDGCVRLGVNTVGRKVDFGSEIEADFNPDLRLGTGTVFMEIGRDIRVRAFLGFQGRKNLGIRSNTDIEFLYGINFMTWF